MMLVDCCAENLAKKTFIASLLCQTIQFVTVLVGRPVNAGR